MRAFTAADSVFSARSNRASDYERLKRPLNRARFDLGFAAGDLIQGPRSYVQLYKDGAERLAEALERGHVVPLQRELFGLDEIARAEVIGERPARKPRKSPVREDILRGRGGAVAGKRN